jgi:hypothetical protein
MLQQKESLKIERRKAAIATKLQKEQIAKVMEEVRTNASKANKIISMALTGKVSLEALTNEGGAKKTSKHRSKSANKNRDNGQDNGDGKDAKLKTSPEKLGLGNRQSKSAGNLKEELAKGMAASEKLDLVYGAAPGALSPPKAYVSPYDFESS